jgi:hypothetical protein
MAIYCARVFFDPSTLAVADILSKGKIVTFCFALGGYPCITVIVFLSNNQQDISYCICPVL